MPFLTKNGHYTIYSSTDVRFYPLTTICVVTYNEKRIAKKKDGASNTVRVDDKVSPPCNIIVYLYHTEPKFDCQQRENTGKHPILVGNSRKYEYFPGLQMMKKFFQAPPFRHPGAPFSLPSIRDENNPGTGSAGKAEKALDWRILRESSCYLG